jgi:type I restriction enzyme M protein
MSMVLTTGNTNTNIVKCDSLCENQFIQDTKVDCIVTNPPFGTSMKYDDLKVKFEKTFPNSVVAFEDIYPLKTNNGACLFVQHCVYMLNEGGVCAVVLPDGELFEGNSQWSKKFRKWLCENVNIRTILKAPSGVFEHAGVKTNVVIFTNDGPTQSIRFLETNKECNEVRDMFSVTMDELVATKFSLDVGEYIEDVSENYDVPMVALGDVCDVINGSQLDKKDIINGDYPVFGGGKKNVGSHNKFNRNGDEIIVCGTGAYCGFVQRCMKPYWASQCFTINSKNKNLNSDYLYYLSKYSLETKFMSSKKGGGQPYIRGSQFINHKIPLPSLEVQQQIVDELTLVEESTTTIQTRLDQLKREKEQYRKYGKKAEIRALLEGSDSKMLGDICEINGGKGINERSKEQTIENNIPYYDSNGVKGYVSESLYEGEYIITAR